MSVLTEISLFPLDKGASLSPWISKAVAHVRQSGVAYKLSAMGTTIETETPAQALTLVNELFELLQTDSSRIYCTIKMDYNKDKTNALDAKVQSIENKIGTVNK